MSNELLPSNVYDVVLQQESQFASVLSTKAVKWQQECQFAIQALQKNEFLNKTAWGNQKSLQNAIINVASIGVSLNPALKHAYLVPRDNGVCLDISYMGLLNIAQKSGSIEWGQAKLVFANDVYENSGIDTAPNHKQNTFGDKGEVVGVYCVVKLSSGEYLTEEMDIATLNKIKATSKAANGPWKNWPEEMMRKSVVKRASKYWPQTERMSTAVDVLHTIEGLVDVSEGTEPEIASVSEDQKVYFDGLISSEDEIGMFVFSQSFNSTDASSAGASQWVSLLHSFPKGKKGKYGAVVNGMKKNGEAMFADYLSGISNAINNSDDTGATELIAELDDNVLNLIADRIDASFSSALNELRSTVQ